MKNKSIKIAIVGPSFFSYMEAIRDEFKKRNIESSFYDERHSNDIITKIIYRLKLDWLIKKQKENHHKKILSSVMSNGYTDIMLIDVEVVDRNHVKEMKKQGLNVHIYMWDSAKNKGKFLSYLDQLHGKGSFDPNDCKHYNMKYIPLFAEDLFSSARTKIKSRNTDISFCGTLHSDRATYLYQLKKIADKLALKAELLIFFHSKFLFFIKSLINIKSIYFIGKISTKGFSKKYVANSMHNSKFVFDIPHKNQEGLTARTFEALRSGACLITYNNNTNLLPKNLQDRIIIINSIDDITNIDFSNFTPPPKLTDSQEYYLSISRFTDDLLDIMGYLKTTNPSLPKEGALAY